MAKGYGRNLLHHEHYFYDEGPSCCAEAAFEDFKDIIVNSDQNVVIETISIFAQKLIGPVLRAANDKQIDRAFVAFDAFTDFFNETLTQFGVNVLLTRGGFIQKQDSHITNEIYIPVIAFLSNPKWEPVTRDLKDAFDDFQMKTEGGYSSCITHAVSALQGFLQLIVKGKIGKGEIGDLIAEGIKSDLIPKDEFSKKAFSDIESHLMKERQLTGDPHPKKEYANEKSARLLLNLIMVFMQHCIQ